MVYNSMKVNIYYVVNNIVTLYCKKKIYRTTDTVAQFSSYSKLCPHIFCLKAVLATVEVRTGMLREVAEVQEWAMKINGKTFSFVYSLYSRINV